LPKVGDRHATIDEAVHSLQPQRTGASCSSGRATTSRTSTPSSVTLSGASAAIALIRSPAAAGVARRGGSELHERLGMPEALLSRTDLRELVAAPCGRRDFP